MVTIDLTARRQAEVALRESEARFQAITNSIDQMVWSARPDGFHDFFNQRWYDYTGVPDDGDLQYRTGVISLPGSEDVWALGDRGVRCYLWLEGAELTTSLKGKGVKSLPIQYK